MAHPLPLCDRAGSRAAPGWRRARAWAAHLRDRLALACLLCGTRVPGGLCRPCRDAVCASRVSGTPRCAHCDLALPGGAACPDCASVRPAFEWAVAAFDYAWPGDLLIGQLKRQGRYGCAPVLAALLEARWQERVAQTPAIGTSAPGPWPSGDDIAARPSSGGVLVTAVPASRRALRERGYNPAAEVGRAVARRLALDWRPGVLQRAREGEGQKTLGRAARRRGVEGLYRCAGAVQGRAVLVVDDVMTTGSTLNAIALELKRCGATQVWAAVLSRTPARDDDSPHR